MPKKVLDARNITVTYKTEKGPLDTVRNVSLQICSGEIYGLVGESGSGKSTLARAIVRYLPENGFLKSGEIYLGDTDLLSLSRKEMRRVWGGRITMVHQDPNAAVNPSVMIGEQIAEVARAHLNLSKQEARDKALEMLTKVRMADPEAVARRYAHQLSGGMLQRLDVTTEAVILDLIGDLMREYDTAVLYITHNLGVVARVCNRVGVLYAGEIMEEGSIGQVFKNKLHPYTRGLLGCVPRVDVNKKDISLKAIPGFIPRPDQLPPGCVFAPRCELVEEACRETRPLLTEIEEGHLSACRRYEALKSYGEVIADTRQAQEDVEYGELVLEARNVKKYFPVPGGLVLFGKGKKQVVKAVDDITVRMRHSFTMGIVGESGCGKTTFARCIMGLEEATAGEIELEGKLLPYSVAKRPRDTLRKMQMVFQNPDASLNPLHPAGEAVARPLKLLRNMDKKAVQTRVKELFEAVNLPEEYIYRLPHELSGGEKQRVAIARAFAADPILMICDEPISSLDVSVQAALMNLLVDLQESKGTSYLFISHDLSAVRHLSDWIAVVYLGRLWEIGSAEDVFVPPYHPYTEALLSALPIPDPDIKQESIRLKGSVPSAMNIPTGCRFHTRCPRKIGEICEKEEPPWQSIGYHHQLCCHIPAEELQALQGEGLLKKGEGRTEQ